MEWDRMISIIPRMLFNTAIFVPGVTALPIVKNYLARQSFGTGGTDSARYCYSVWLRHLVKSSESGLGTRPRVIAELGPGDSLGMGLAGLLSGASKYYALDVVSHANAERNISILHELVRLFSEKANIPDDDEFPRVQPKLNNYKFPEHLFESELMNANLSADRVQIVENSLRDCLSKESIVQFSAPWLDAAIIEDGMIDMLFSQAVLEHVDDLDNAYKSMGRWLKPSGFLSHVVDFKCHGYAESWNGHWTYSDLQWKLIRGKSSWLLNREPYSVHMRLLALEGFQVVAQDIVRRESDLRTKDLAGRFRGMDPDDLSISDVFFQATKVH
jgi:SAM-dependent methyltransferase